MPVQSQVLSEGTPRSRMQTAAIGTSRPSPRAVSTPRTCHMHSQSTANGSSVREVRGRAAVRGRAPVHMNRVETSETAVTPTFNSVRSSCFSTLYNTSRIFREAPTAMGCEEGRADGGGRMAAAPYSRPRVEIHVARVLSTPARDNLCQLCSLLFCETTLQFAASTFQLFAFRP